MIYHNIIYHGRVSGAKCDAAQNAENLMTLERGKKYFREFFLSTKIFFS
jgi:hypothetical protein